MRILILDDQKLRHDCFQKTYNGNEVVSCYKYSDFVTQLSYSWDLIHLDHDLGDFVDDADYYVDGWGSKQEYTGYHASMRVCELENYPGKVIVHSINSVGAQRMLDNLRRAGINAVWEPFGEPSE